MNPAVKQLIPAVVWYVTHRGGFLTKTRLLKLLYLFDVEYYRRHRNTFTGFQWKFFHLGPWTSEFEPTVNELVGRGILEERQSQKSDFDTKFYRCPEPSDLSRIFADYHDEAAVKGVLDLWGDRPTGEILDYVYFHTEPMEHGIRNEPLDFATVEAEPTRLYRRSASGRTSGQVAVLHRRFEDVLRKMTTTAEQREFDLTPPRYDDEFHDALGKLDKV